MDSGPPSKHRRTDEDLGSGNDEDANKSCLKNPGKPNLKRTPGDDKEKDKKIPVFLLEAHKKQGIRHLLKDCPDYPEA